MADTWQTFPAQMEEHRAFISFNKSYAQIAEKDPRTALLQVRVKIKNPTAAGLPTDEEFAELNTVEDRLTAAIEAIGGVEVGRVTVNGQRYFSFYLSLAEAPASKLVTDVQKNAPYRLQFAYKLDPHKDGYWKELYPTADGWQVIRDLEVLDALRSRGDDPQSVREVSHWAYFADQATANLFAAWAKTAAYAVTSVADR